MVEATYDLIVIGAGPGGYVAAIRAAQLGMRVACVEKEATLGGTCLNIGCIPSKALLDSSERFFQARKRMVEHGIVLAGVELDLGVMMARKEHVVAGFTKGVASLFRKNGVTHVTGRARLLGAGTVEVSGGTRQTLGATRILLATGSEPVGLAELPFDGERILSSTEALALRSVPGRMAVVGGGAIGLELGSVWSRLGSEVVVVEMLERIVPGMDGQMAAGLERALEKQGLRFRLGSRVTRASGHPDGIDLTIASAGEQVEERFDVVLVAVGRRPHTTDLGLDQVGVATDERGRVRVNDSFETSVPGIYAVGDLVPGPMLAHKASEEGIAAVERMAGLAGHVNYDAIPNVVYTWPELACVGLGEDEATGRGLSIRSGTFPFAANGRARCAGESDGSVKVIADQRTDRILGVHILGPNASELIAEATLALEFSASSEDLARTVHAHPTLAEALKEAALAVAGRAIHR